MKNGKTTSRNVLWRKWLEADRPERLRLLEGLPIFRLVGDPLAEGLTSVLLNSYLEDFKDAVECWIARELGY